MLYEERPLWNPKIELMRREEIRKLQFENLKKQLIRCYEQSSYYKNKFGKAKVNPHKLRSLEEYAAYPFFDKEEERISQEESKEKLGHCFGMHIVCDPKKVIRISSTSGTTGKPTFTGYTQKDREAVNETGARCMWRIGARPGDVILHAFVLSMWIAGAPVVDLIQNVGCCAVPIGALTGVERFSQIAKEVFPVQLNCTPSYAEYLIKKLPERVGINARELEIKRITLAGEPGGSVAHIRQGIEEGFGAKVYDMIGSTGAAFCSSMSCDAHEGMHFLAEDYCLFEVVDPKTLEPLPLEDGVEGEIVTTGLEKECAPLPRWRDKDIVQVFTNPCECGKPGFRFIVKGRADDMLLIRGVNVYPYAVKDVVMEFSPKVTGNIRIVLDNSPPVVSPPLPLRVEYTPALAKEQIKTIAQEIEDRIHNLLRFRAKVEMIPPGKLSETISATHKSNLLEKRYEEKS